MLNEIFNVIPKFLVRTLEKVTCSFCFDDGSCIFGMSVPIWAILQLIDHDYGSLEQKRTRSNYCLLWKFNLVITTWDNQNTSKRKGTFTTTNDSTVGPIPPGHRHRQFSKTLVENDNSHTLLPYSLPYTSWGLVFDRHVLGVQIPPLTRCLEALGLICTNNNTISPFFFFSVFMFCMSLGLLMHNNVPDRGNPWFSSSKPWIPPSNRGINHHPSVKCFTWHDIYGKCMDP